MNKKILIVLSVFIINIDAMERPTNNPPINNSLAKARVYLIQMIELTHYIANSFVAIRRMEDAQLENNRLVKLQPTTETVSELIAFSGTITILINNTQTMVIEGQKMLAMLLSNIAALVGRKLSPFNKNIFMRIPNNFNTLDQYIKSSQSRLAEIITIVEKGVLNEFDDRKIRLLLPIIEEHTTIIYHISTILLQELLQKQININTEIIGSI